MQQRINYPTHSMRIANQTWERIRLHKFLRKMTWNQLLDHLLNLDVNITGTKADGTQNDDFNRSN